jgi:hypothetical protein
VNQLEIKPIVFQVAPVSVVPQKSAGQSFMPWVLVALLAGVLVLLAVRSFSGGDYPGPGPVVVDEATAKVVIDASKSYSLELAKVMDELANRVDAGAIRNWDQLSTNARALSGPARERSFSPVDVLDTAKVPAGEWTENRGVVSAHLRSKAEGHRRAAQ